MIYGSTERKGAKTHLAKGRRGMCKLQIRVEMSGHGSGPADDTARLRTKSSA